LSIGQHVTRGQVNRLRGPVRPRQPAPHSYEVRVHKVAVNPHKYLRTTYQQIAFSDPGDTAPSAM